MSSHMTSEVFTKFVEAERKAAGWNKSVIPPRPRSEYIPDDNFESANFYKIIYRSLSTLLASSSIFLEEIMQDKVLNLNEALEFLKAAHPYFEWSLKDKNNIEEFEDVYQFIYDAWYS